MKKTMAVMILLAGGLFAAPRVRFGVTIGAPAPMVAAIPPSPGPGYTWVNGYYAPDGAWMAGYWAPPAVVVAPPARYDRDHFDRGRVIDRRVDRDDRFRR